MQDLLDTYALDSLPQHLLDALDRIGTLQLHTQICIACTRSRIWPEIHETVRHFIGEYPEIRLRLWLGSFVPGDIVSPDHWEPTAKVTVVTG